MQTREEYDQAIVEAVNEGQMGLAEYLSERADRAFPPMEETA